MTDTNSASGSTSEAKETASAVAHDATDAGRKVAGTARDESTRVAKEAGGQAKKLAKQATQELNEQAAGQQQRVAGGLESLGSELRAMANGSDQQGVASELVHQVADRVNSVAQWLGKGDPSTLLADVKAFARQRPGIFIAAAAGAGILTGRLVKSLGDSAKEEREASASAPSVDTYARPVTPVYDVPSTLPAPSDVETGYGASAPVYDASAPVYDEIVNERGDYKP